MVPSRPRSNRCYYFNLLAFVAFALSFSCGVYTFENRYFLRFIPLTLKFANAVNEGSWLLPSSQIAKPMGSLEFPKNDLTTEAGLRDALNFIQELSPTKNVNGMPNYDGITFNKWVDEVTNKPFFCTDATQLFILTAWQQGLAAREWHILPPQWPPGQGHSVAEFYNPVTRRWQLVDAQHAAIIRGPNNQITDMINVLESYRDSREDQIKVDYGPYREAILSGSRGPSVESYFFENGLLSTPVLQLRQATWFASVPRIFGLSGHFVIGYPIVVDGWTHDNRVWISKITAALAIMFLVISIAALWARVTSPKLN